MCILRYDMAEKTMKPSQGKIGRITVDRNGVAAIPYRYLNPKSQKHNSPINSLISHASFTLHMPIKPLIHTNASGYDWPTSPLAIDSRTGHDSSMTSAVVFRVSPARIAA